MLCLSGFELYCRWVPLLSEARPQTSCCFVVLGKLLVM